MTSVGPAAEFLGHAGWKFKVKVSSICKGPTSDQMGGGRPSGRGLKVINYLYYQAKQGDNLERTEIKSYLKSDYNNLNAYNFSVHLQILHQTEW